ncbi:MAG: TIGR03936 family radical SAM-associated protein [Firmicutes bacterium]|nr:TIGR03936 family radical SAM-associated protein [Bacillota bacterium]
MKYVIEFSKTGTICYTSHLDIMKVFQRSFKRAGIELAYSQGFNPHPKMGFAQPLSLGYEALEEFIEFETDIAYDARNVSDQVILDEMRKLMPEGLDLKSIKRNEDMKKTLAADTDAAEYTAIIPMDTGSLGMTQVQLWEKYMGQDEIITLKKQKQKKKGRGRGPKTEIVMVETNIKPKIRELIFTVRPDELKLDMLLDSGSVSNLSPELVITTVIECLGQDVDRSEVAVTRNRIIFNNYDTGH